MQECKLCGKDVPELFMNIDAAAEHRSKELVV
jgi:hypothetical protein